jgi:hypothetical protein
MLPGLDDLSLRIQDLNPVGKDPTVHAGIFIGIVIGRITPSPFHRLE